MENLARDYDHGSPRADPGDIDLKNKEGWQEAIEFMAANLGIKNNKKKNQEGKTI